MIHEQNRPAVAALCGAEANNLPGACVLPADHAGRHADAEGFTWAHGHKYGRPDLYEITWMSGHVETIPAHQVTYPQRGLVMAGLRSFSLGEEGGPPRVQLHAELDGRWCLTLSAREEDIRTMRLVTNAERIPGGGS